MRSWKTPTPEQVDRVLSLMVRKEQYRYFFYKLENPEWLEPLKEKGFFLKENAPKIDRDEKKGTIGFPLWPETHFLARMAAYKPDIVLDFILPLVEVDNVSVHVDLADAALAMPPELAAKWVKKEIAWIKEQGNLYLLLPDKLGKLMASLARGGQIDTALKLAGALLEVLPNAHWTSEMKEENPYALPKDPLARFDIWRYEEMFKEDVPELTRSARDGALDLLCGLLARANEFARRERESKSTEDFSSIWRSSIEHAEQPSYGIQNILVSGIRDAASLLIQERLLTVQEVISILSKRSWTVFRRIGLYLLKKFSEQAPELVAERLTDHDAFENHMIRPEYPLLMRKCFAMLPPDKKQMVLDWIQKGPAPEITKRFAERIPGQEEMEKYIARWQRDRFAWFKDQLPPEQVVQYQELIKKFGEPEDPEHSISMKEGGWVGPTSPTSVDELKKMSVEGILEHLRTWVPPGGMMVPTPEGLGRNLTEAVQQDPNRFAEKAQSFKDVHPTYVRALISGLSAGLKQGHAYDLTESLELCRLVVTQPREMPQKYQGFCKGTPPDWDCDSDWGATRATIARFLSEGLSGKKFAYAQREKIWSILEPITEDPDPTEERENKYGMDPASLSINSTRGEAMHTVMRYALWIRQHLEEQPDAQQKIDHGFDEMPEVRTVLEKHLDLLEEKTFAIRAVYGQWLPWLILFDAGWVRKNMDKIFLLADKPPQLFYESVWNTYIVFCAPYDNVFEVIKDQYVLAVGALAEPKSENQMRREPDKHLAEHLMVFNWRGKLDSALLDAFWNKANSKLRGYALESVGRSLYRGEGAVAPQIIDRIRSLWESRLAEVKEQPGFNGECPEMSAFGWWYISKKFDDAWAIDQLLEALKIAGRVDPTHMVADRLAEVVALFPEKVIKALRLIVDGEKERWGFASWSDMAKKILRHALGTDARQSAEDLIHYLGSRGYLEFGELLHG